MKYTISDLKNEIIEFHKSFKKFKPLNFENYYEDEIEVTYSSEVLLRKSGLFPDFQEEDIIELPSSNESLESYKKFNILILFSTLSRALP